MSDISAFQSREEKQVSTFEYLFHYSLNPNIPSWEYEHATEIIAGVRPVLSLIVDHFDYDLNNGNNSCEKWVIHNVQVFFHSSIKLI